MAKELGQTKDRIVIRQREMQDGGASLFLDIHHNGNHNGKRTREHLKLYLVPGNSRAAKELNKQTMAQAEVIRAQRQIEMQSGEYDVLHEFKTDTLFLSYYREMCTARLKTASQGNWGNWRGCLRYLENYCDETTTFKEITPRWIEGFKEYLENAEIKPKHRCSHPTDEGFRGLSQNSKLSYFNKLKACVNKAFEDRIIPKNPFRGIKGFKEEESEREYLTWEEVEKLDSTECNDPFLKRAFLFSCFTGLRKSDILKLTWGEIHKLGEFTRIIFKQKKTGGQEYLDIPKQAEKYLGEHGDMDERVFASFRYSEKTTFELKRWAKKAGVEKEFTYHASRHTFAVLLLYFGADIYTVSKMLGHKELATTQIYAKVLAKMGSKFAKQYKGYNGVCMIDTDEKRRKALELFDLSDVWGIGRHTFEKLTYYGIHTPLELADKSESWVRSILKKPGYQTWLELNGIPCIDTSEVRQKQTICTSRSFGDMVSDISALREPVASFASSCANKLRAQQSGCTYVTVFVASNFFREDLQQYNNSATVTLPVASSDTLEITRAAMKALAKVYVPGIMYKRAAVVVSGVVPMTPLQQDLFDPIQNRPARAKLMKAIDSINAKYGLKTVHLGIEGAKDEKQAWKVKCAHKSPNYLTNINEILTIKI